MAADTDGDGNGDVNVRVTGFESVDLNTQGNVIISGENLNVQGGNVTFSDDRSVEIEGANVSVNVANQMLVQGGTASIFAVAAVAGPDLFRIRSRHQLSRYQRESAAHSGW